MGQLLIEKHGLPLDPGLLIGNMHAAVLNLHVLGFGTALFPVLSVVPYLHLLGNVLENILVAVGFLELLLYLLLTLDVDEKLHLPMLPGV